MNTQSRKSISSFKNPLSITLIAILLILIGYSIYFLCRHTPRRIWLLLLILIGIPALALALPDLIFGGIRSYSSRYLIAHYLGIHLAVAYLIATKVTEVTSGIWRQRIWQIAMAVLISLGVFSNAFISQAETWWNKYNTEIPQIARIVNQANSPLLIVDKYWLSRGNVLSLKNFLKPKVQLQLLGERDITKVPDGFSDVFLFCPSQELLDRLEKEQKFKIESFDNNAFPIWASLYKLVEVKN